MCIHCLYSISTMECVSCWMVLIYFYLNLSGTAGLCPDKPMTFNDAVMFCQKNSGTLAYDSEETGACFPDTQDAWYGTYSELTSWFSLQGCYQINPSVDTIDAVAMKDRNTSFIDCYNSCKEQDHIYEYFYVQRNACLCSNSLHEHVEVDDRLCSKRCGGDVTLFCGGDQDFFTVYKEEHLLYSNNNNDQLCMYQTIATSNGSCVPPRDVESENCNTPLKSICGEHVSPKNNTWSGSVNDCFTTRGQFLKSAVDCKIQNKERLWLGIFREHVTYYASDRPPLPGKPLTGCGVITNNSTITYENCRQEKAFICKTSSGYNSTEGGGNAGSICNVTDTGDNSEISTGRISSEDVPTPQATDGKPEGLNHLTVALIIALVCVLIILVVLLSLSRKNLSKPSSQTLAITNKGKICRSDTEMTLLTPPENPNTEEEEKHRYYCIYSLKKNVSDTVEQISIQAPETSDVKFVYDLAKAKPDETKSPGDENAPEEMKTEQDCASFTYEFANNKIELEDDRNPKDSELSAGRTRFAYSMVKNKFGTMDETSPYQEVNAEEYDILRQPRAKVGDIQESNYSELPRAQLGNCEDIIHEQLLQEF